MLENRRRVYLNVVRWLMSNRSESKQKRGRIEMKRERQSDRFTGTENGIIL